MQIKQKGDVTTIRYIAVEQIEKAKFIGFLLLMFPGIPLFLAGDYLSSFPGFRTYVLLFYFASLVVLLFYGSYERKVEIHPERIYVKNYITEKELEFPVKKDKMVLMIENEPFVQVIIPREKWRILIAYENETLFFSEDFNDCFCIRSIVKKLSEKLNLPVVDYTYQDQNDIIMYYMPGEIGMPFTERATRYSDLIILGEEPSGNTINEEIISFNHRRYLWSPLTMSRFVMISLVAGFFAVMVLIRVIGVAESLIDLPMFYDNGVLLTFILLIYLGFLAYQSGIRKTLELSSDKVRYSEIFFGMKLKETVLTTSGIEEVRLKPVPGGFATLITGSENLIRLMTHQGGMQDFGSLLWLTGRIQDFLLKNRSQGHAEQKTADKNKETESERQI